jgi:hypothetical protein
LGTGIQRNADRFTRCFFNDGLLLVEGLVPGLESENQTQFFRERGFRVVMENNLGHAMPAPVNIRWCVGSNLVRA